MKIQIGIASTTHIDRDNQRMAKSALEDMSEQINQKFIPQLIEHDWDRQIGILLYGEVFRLNDGEYALGIVYGVFENEEEKNTYKISSKNNVWHKYKKYLNIDELLKLSDENSKNIKRIENNITKDLSFADLLEKYLNSTEISPNGDIYIKKHFITSIGDLKIEIYPKDHYPAHFHIVSKQRNLNSRFHLETFEYISTKHGTITEKDKKKIKTFFINNPNMVKKLISEYKRLS